jgi:hypothetical protein
MNGDEAVAQRTCPACAACQPIRPDEPVWPPGWRCHACGHVIAQSSGIPMLAPELADTISGFDPDSFALLADIEASHFWFVARNELMVGLSDRYFPEARSFLEIGCGNGIVLSALKGSRHWERLVASDLHPTGLAPRRRDDHLGPATSLVMERRGRRRPSSTEVSARRAGNEAAAKRFRDPGVVVLYGDLAAVDGRQPDQGAHQAGRAGFESRGLAQSHGQRRAAGDPARLSLAGLHWPAGGSRVVVARAV